MSSNEQHGIQPQLELALMKTRLPIPVKDFRVTELVRVTAEQVVDKNKPCIHVRTSLYQGDKQHSKATIGYQYMVSYDLLDYMTDSARLQILSDMHHKVIHEYSRQFWGSPFEIERQGNDQNA
jgi:hypothetical protein